jgi:2-methylcitrate dehydratase PrpD
MIIKMKVNDIITPLEDPAGKLAEFAANLRYEDIPEEHADFIKRDVLDMIACLFGGSTGPTVPIVVDSVRSFGGQGAGRILIFGDFAPTPLAGFVNGTIARAVDMGDTGTKGGHICEWIIPALFTYLSGSKEPISGKQFITAFAAGAEWGAREHNTTKLPFHPNTNPGECAGSRYATVALSKMMGFSKEEIWNAAGMAYSAHPQHEQQKYAEGTPDVRLQHGYVVSNAIQITDLVKRGLRGVHGIYMGHSGLLKMITYTDILSPDFLSEDIGKRWVWREGIQQKLYTGCYYNHTTLYSMISIMKEHGFKREDIKSAHFRVSVACDHTWGPIEVKSNPKTPEEALFSNPYSITQAAFTGDCFLDAFQKENFERNMSNPEFVDFMHKLTYELDPAIETAFDNYGITVTLKDGRKFSKVETDLPGNLTNQLTWDQVINKFHKASKFAAVDLGEEKYNKIIAFCRNMENMEDIHELVKVLLP